MGRKNTKSIEDRAQELVDGFDTESLDRGESLSDLRAFLKAVIDAARDRITTLNSEIGEDE